MEDATGTRLSAIMNKEDDYSTPIGGATPKFLGGWAKSAAYDRRSTSNLWPITHNIGIWDKQKSCGMCAKIQPRVQDDFAHSSIEIFITIN